jgi:diguanylate cyclase (GGDEF)-like protein
MAGRRFTEEARYIDGLTHGILKDAVQFGSVFSVKEVRMWARYRRLARSPGSALALFGVLLCVATIVLFVTDLRDRYQERIAAAKTNAMSFARILAEHTVVTFEDIDRVLLEAEAIRKNSLMHGSFDPTPANLALRQLQKSSSVLVAVGWTDANGDVLRHSYQHELPRKNISDLSHFIVQREKLNNGLFIAPPYRSAASDKWFSAASRRLSNPDGSFAGVVTAPLDQSYFTKIYRSIDLGKDGSIILLHREGQIMARQPEQRDAIGKSVADGPLFTKYLPKAEIGAYELTSPIDGVDRIAGYRAVPGLPLVVAVTYARSEVLEVWYRHLYTYGLVVAIVITVILLGTFALVRQANAILARTRDLARTNARFDAALSNMPNGLSMFDADGRLLVANSRYLAMYDLSADAAKPGTSLRSIVQHYNARRDDLDVNRFMEGAHTRAAEILTLTNGRIVQIQRTPMQDGGWVATHEDISEKRQADERLARNAEELKRTNDRFDAAISNMNQGLCLFDANRNLVVSNRRYQEMYDLPDELVQPGTSLNRILQHYTDRGEPNKNLTVGQHAELMSTLRKQEYELKDQRQILIQRKALPDGGWVATHEDVTEQRRAEQLLAEKAAALEAMNVRFDAALNNMSQGLCMFDAEQKVVVSNAQYAEIYHLTPDQVAPGTTLAQILEYRRLKGTMFADVAADVYCAEHVRRQKEIRELADGRVIAIARHMMADGAWLTTHEDITDRARSEKNIAFLAQHDLLTGLANRALFSEKLEEVAKRVQRQETTFTVLMLDLDKFKNVNDTLGHPAGDQLLIQVAERLKSSLRETDVLARLGGDEFAIIQENDKNQHEGAIALALRIIALIEQPFDLDGNTVRVGTSIGIAFAPEHGVEPETLLQKADVALYAAKTGGRNDYRTFEPGLTEAADLQRSIEEELRQAAAREEFELYYQPIIDAKTRAVCGAEAFLRWRHPSKGVLLPDQFLPLAESIGLMPQIGEWILQRACLDATAWPSDVKVAVNISATQFRKGNLFDVVLCSLVDSGLSPDRLELEIGDSVLLEADRGSVLAIIRQLSNLGVSVALDGCGAAYAAIGSGLPFNKIKIDRHVAQGLGTRRDCNAVLASVGALAKHLDITMAAKGVETSEQLEGLFAAGVDFAQGHLFGKPVPLAALDFHSVSGPGLADFTAATLLQSSGRKS